MSSFQPIADRRIRFALVGCGRISANHVEALRQHGERAEWVAVCDRQPEALAAAVQATGAPGFASLDALLADSRPDHRPDIVVLATPSGLHSPQAIQVARAGCHVLTEKPMATKWTTAWRMVRACDEAGVQALRRQAEPANATLQLLKRAVDARALRPHLHGAPSTSSGRVRRATTTAPPGAAPGSSTAAPS
jgi:UDP-N-acetyl-2-amino-2-deoxyglucuronate dehydrogenase